MQWISLVAMWKLMFVRDVYTIYWCETIAGKWRARTAVGWEPPTFNKLCALEHACCFARVVCGTDYKIITPHTACWKLEMSFTVLFYYDNFKLFLIRAGHRVYKYRNAIALYPCFKMRCHKTKLIWPRILNKLCSFEFLLIQLFTLNSRLHYLIIKFAFFYSKPSIHMPLLGTKVLDYKNVLCKTKIPFINVNYILWLNWVGSLYSLPKLFVR
jgi:hypothetical protein